MEELDAVVVGAGPCGLAAAIALRREGFRVRVYERECVAASIVRYPLDVTFFSTAERLSLGGLPFVLAAPKPGRRDALAYYREVVRYFGLDVRQYEEVENIHGHEGAFVVHTCRRSGLRGMVGARWVVVATGYWGDPNRLGVPGEDLPHVSHRFVEGHLSFQQPVVVVGGGNSAAEAALELWRAGAGVTLVHFGSDFDRKIKPWLRPDLENRIAEGKIAVRWNSRLRAIEPEWVVVARGDGSDERLRAEHVFLLTGYAPDVTLLVRAGVTIDPASGVPAHDPATLETDVPGIFIAGVLAAGYDANRIFIENGRFHGDRIAARLAGRLPPELPPLSRDLDG